MVPVPCGKFYSPDLLGPHIVQGNMISVILLHESMGEKVGQCVKDTALREGCNVKQPWTPS